MPFTIQDQNTGLFWSQGFWGRVALSASPETYVLEGGMLRRQNGGYIGQRFNILHEGDVATFEINDGVITCDGRQVSAGVWATVVDGVGSQWVISEIAAPVNRAAALIAEAQRKCEDCDCDPCECDTEAQCKCEDCDCDPCECDAVPPAPTQSPAQ